MSSVSCEYGFGPTHLNARFTNRCDNPRGHAATAHRQPDAIEIVHLFDQLQTKRALPGNYIIVVVWRHERRAGLCQHLLEFGFPISKRWPARDDATFVAFDVGAFEPRRRLGYDDPRRRIDNPSRARKRRAVITRGMRSDTHPTIRFPQAQHRIHRTANLERAGLLQVFTLEKQLCAGQVVQAFARDHRGAVHVRADAPRGIHHICVV